jgi:hypothetical protein
MQSFEIEKYKPVYHGHVPLNHTPHRVHQQHHPGAHMGEWGPFQPLGKLEYASFLSKLKLKVGDFLVSNSINGTSFSEWQVYYLCGIQEIHHQITNWGTKHSGPHILEIVSYMPGSETKLGRSYYGGTNLYKKVPEEQVAKIFREAVYAIFRDHQAPTSVEADTLQLIETKI